MLGKHQTHSRSPSSLCCTDLLRMWGFLGFTALQCLRCPFFSAPSASKNPFPQQLFSPLPNALHCITFKDFLTAPLKQTRKPPSHPYPSPHTFPLPLCYFSFAQGNIFTVTASWVPYNSHFSLTNFSLSLSVVLVFPLYPFPMSLQPACTVNQDTRMLC